MIGSPRSRCKTCRLLVEVLEVANDTDHQEPMKDRVGVGRNCPCLGDTSTRSPHSFYFPCRDER
jgi:hypothetical protein